MSCIESWPGLKEQFSEAGFWRLILPGYFWHYYPSACWILGAIRDLGQQIEELLWFPGLALLIAQYQGQRCVQNVPRSSPG